MSYLQLRHISLKYSNQIGPILSNINLDIEKNTITAIVGESGSGKSTLLNCISGFQTPEKGEISLDHTPIFTEKHYVNPEKRCIGMIFQDYALFPHMNIRRNILYGIKKLPRFTQNRRLLKLTNVFKVRDLLHKFPHQLSGGEQQRVSKVTGKR